MLKNIDNYIGETLKSLLYSTIPEYKLTHDNIFKNDGIYLFMSDFAEDLGKKLIKGDSLNYVKEAFQYINLLGESNNLEVINIVRIGILEILYTTKGLNKNIVKNLLCDKLKDMFDEFDNYYQ